MTMPDSHPPISRPGAPLVPVGERELDLAALEWILEARAMKDSFETIEDIRRPLAEELHWRRRRVAWRDAFDDEVDLSLCINELRLGPHSPARIEPSIAMANPGLVDFPSIEHAYWQTYWAQDLLRVDSTHLEPRLFVNMRALTCSRSGAPRGLWEDLERLEEMIAEGELTAEKLDLFPAMTPTLRQEGDGRIEIVRYLPANQPSRCVQAEHRVLAAVNAGYFLNFPEEYEDGLSALHQPIGALYSDGALHMPPWIDRPCAIQWADGRNAIELLGPQNLALAVNHEKPYLLQLGISDRNGPATVWRSFDPEPPECPADVACVELVFSGSGLARLARPGECQAPIGGALVRLSGAAAGPWIDFLEKRQPFPAWRIDLVTSSAAPLQWVVAGGPELVHDGRPLPADRLADPLFAGEFRRKGPPPTRFPYAEDTAAPRTAIGITAHDHWVIVVVDGRSPQEHSMGLTLGQLARLMRALGCVQALNLDGGGSSVMAVEGVSAIDQLSPGLSGGVVNLPSDPGGRERLVPVVLTVANPP